jgi:hypothetical protein
MGVSGQPAVVAGGSAAKVCASVFSMDLTSIRRQSDSTEQGCVSLLDKVQDFRLATLAPDWMPAIEGIGRSLAISSRITWSGYNRSEREFGGWVILWMTMAGILSFEA